MNSNMKKCKNKDILNHIPRSKLKTFFKFFRSVGNAQLNNL